MVLGGLAWGITNGKGARAISGPKKRHPKRSFSMRQALPSTCMGREKDMGWPIPARHKPSSRSKRKTSGPSIMADRRKSHSRTGGVAGSGGPAAEAGLERLELE